MNELRWNPLAGQWVTIATERAARPSDFAPRFLPVEAEPDRPVPVLPRPRGRLPARPSSPTPGTASGGSGWCPTSTRPSGAIEPLDLTVLGPVFTQAPASGIHEVLVLSPDHQRAWADLDDRQVALVMAAVRDRVEDHGRHAVVRHSLVIVNHGREAGASLEHPHGQLLGTPFVSRVVADEAAAFADFDRRVPAVHHRRRGAVRRPPRGGRQRARRRPQPLLGGLALRAAGAAHQPPGRGHRLGPARRRGRGPGRCGTACAGCGPCWATSPTTSSCTPPPGATTGPTTGTSTWSPG